MKGNENVAKAASGKQETPLEQCDWASICTMRCVTGAGSASILVPRGLRVVVSSMRPGPESQLCHVLLPRLLCGDLLAPEFPRP